MVINRLEINFNSLPKAKKTETPEKQVDQRKKACELLARQIHPRLLDLLNKAGVDVKSFIYKDMVKMLYGDDKSPGLVRDVDRDGNPDFNLADLYAALPVDTQNIIKEKLGSENVEQKFVASMSEGFKDITLENSGLKIAKYSYDSSTGVPSLEGIFAEEIEKANNQIKKAIEAAKLKQEEILKEVLVKVGQNDEGILLLRQKLATAIGDETIFNATKRNLISVISKDKKLLTKLGLEEKDDIADFIAAMENLTYKGVRSKEPVASEEIKYARTLNQIQAVLNKEDEINRFLNNACSFYLILEESGYKEPDILKMSIEGMRNKAMDSLSSKTMPESGFYKFLNEMDNAINYISHSTNKKNIIIKADGSINFNRFVSYFRQIIEKSPDLLIKRTVDKDFADGKEEHIYKLEGFGLITLVYKPEGAAIQTNKPEICQLDPKHKELRQELIEKFYNHDSGSYPVSYYMNPRDIQMQPLQIMGDSVFSDYLIDETKVDVPLTYAIRSMNYMIYHQDIQDSLNKCVEILSKYWPQEKINTFFDIKVGSIAFRDGEEVEPNFKKEFEKLPEDSGIKTAFLDFKNIQKKLNDWRFYKDDYSQELNIDFREMIELAESKGGPAGSDGISPTNIPPTKVKTFLNGMVTAFGLSMDFIQKPSLATIPPVDDWHMINIKAAYLEERKPEQYKKLLAIKESIGLGRELNENIKKEIEALTVLDKDFSQWLAETYLHEGFFQGFDQKVTTNVHKALFRSENILLPDNRSLSLPEIMEEYREIVSDEQTLDNMYSWNDIGAEAKKIMIDRGFVINDKLVKVPTQGEIDSINAMVVNQKILNELNKRGYQKLEDAPESLVKELTKSINGNYKGFTIEDISRRQIFQGATNLLLHGIKVKDSGSVDTEKKSFGWEMVQSTLNTLFIGEVVTEHFGATIKSYLLTSMKDETEMQKVKLSFLGSDIDDLEDVHLKILAKVVLDLGAKLGKDTKEYKWALTKADALNRLAASLDKPLTCTNKTMEDDRVKLVVDAIYFLRQMMQKNRYIQMGGKAYDTKPSSKSMVSRAASTVSGAASALGNMNYDKDKVISTDLSKLLSDMLDTPDEFGLLQVVSAAGSVLWQPIQTTWEFGVEMGVNLTALQLQVFQNFKNYASGSTYSMVTDENGNVVVDQDTGKVSFRKVGLQECLDIAAQVTSTILQLRLIAPVKFYDFFGITDDWHDDSYLSAYLKFAAANFLMLSSAKGFWNSMMGRAFKTAGLVDPIAFTQFAARQWGKRFETKAGRLGMFAPILDLLQAKHNKMKPGEEKTKIQKQITKMKSMIKTGSSTFVNPLGHLMRGVGKMADPKAADEKKFSKTAAKVALGVLGKWQDINQILSPYAYEGKKISKWIKACKKIINSENGDFSLNIEEHDLNKFINGNKTLAELEKNIKIPPTIKIRIGNNSLIDASVIKVSIGSIGSNNDVTQAKHPVDIRVHYAGQGAPVSSETVSVELVINESFVRNALRNTKISGLSDKQNLKVAYAQLSQQINMHIQLLSQRVSNMVLPAPHGEGGRESVLNPLEVEKGLANIGVIVDKDVSQLIALNEDGFKRLKSYLRQNKINILTEPVLIKFINSGFYQERSAVVSDRIVFEEIIHPLFNAKDMEIKEVDKIVDKDGQLDPIKLREVLRNRILSAINSGKISLPGLDANNPDSSIVEMLLSEVETKFNRYYESFSFAKAVNKKVTSQEVADIFKNRTSETAALNQSFKLYDAEINKQLFEVDKIPKSIRENKKIFDLYFKTIEGTTNYVKLKGDINKIMESIKDNSDLNKKESQQLLKELKKASKSVNTARLERFELEIQKQGKFLKEIYIQLQEDYKKAVDSGDENRIREENIKRAAVLSRLYQSSDGKLPNFSQTMFLKYNHLPGSDYWFNLGTGEGKSIVSYLLTLDQLIRGKAEGDKVILTSSDPALVEKAYLEAKPLFKMLGISVNTFSSDLNTFTIKELKANMDNTEVLFCLNTDLHFANAHDRKQVDPEYKIMESFRKRVVIHDEGDLARFESEHSPVVISNASNSLDKYSSQWGKAVSLIENAKKQKGLILCDFSKKTIVLNRELIPFIEKNAPSIYKLITSSDSAEKAAGWKILTATARVNYFHKNQVHYVVEGKTVKFMFDVREVVLIDELTGFRKPGHALQDGLMQAIQAKEGLPVNEEMHSDTVSLPEDTMKKAKRGFSISGTFDVSKSLLKKAMHGLFVQPTVAVTRVDMPDVLAKDKATQRRIIKDNLMSPNVKEFAHLICVKSKEEAIDLQKYLDKYFDIKIEILFDSEDKSKNERIRILNNAGKPGHITIATIAGRGTDIKTQNKTLSDLADISAKGGLTVTITDYYQDTRVIEQIRGRCNRLLNPTGGGSPTDRGNGTTWLVASIDGLYFEERPTEKNMLEKLFFKNNAKAVVVKEENTRERYQNTEQRQLNKTQVEDYFKYVEEVSGEKISEQQKAAYINVMKTVYAENEYLYRMGQDRQGESLYERNQAIFRFEGQIGDRLSSITKPSEFIDFYIDMMHKSVDAVLTNHTIVLTDTITNKNIKFFRVYFGRAKKLGMDVNRLGIKNLDDFIGKPVYELVNLLKEEKWVRKILEESFSKKSYVRGKLDNRMSKNTEVDNIRNNLELVYNEVRAEAHKMNHLYGNQVQYQTHENGRADLEKELQEKLEMHIFNKFSLRFMDRYRNFLSGTTIDAESFSSTRSLAFELDISKKEALEEFAKTREHVEVEHVKDTKFVRLCFKRLANNADIADLQKILTQSELSVLEVLPENKTEKENLKELVEKSLEATLKDIGAPIKQFEPRKIRFMGTYFSLGNQNDIAAINDLLKSLGSKKILVSEWKGDHDAFFYGEQKGEPKEIKITNADGEKKTVLVVTVSKEIINNPNRVLGFTFMQKSNLLGLGRSDNLIILRPDEIRKQYREMALIAFSHKYVNESAKNSAFEFFKLHGIGNLKEAGIDPRDSRNDIYNKSHLSNSEMSMKTKIGEIIKLMVKTVFEHEKAHQKDDPRPKKYSHFRFINGGQYVQNRGLIDVLSEFRADYGGRLNAILEMKDVTAQKSELARMAYEASHYTNESYKNTLQREVAEAYLNLYEKALLNNDYKDLKSFAEKIETSFKHRIKTVCKDLGRLYSKEIGKRKNAPEYDKKTDMENGKDFSSKKKIIDEENRKEGKSPAEYIVKAATQEIFADFNKDAIIEIHEQAKKINKEIHARDGLKAVKVNIINMIISDPDRGMRVLEDIDISFSDRTEIIKEVFEQAFLNSKEVPDNITKEIYMRSGSDKIAIVEFLQTSEAFTSKNQLYKYLLELAVIPVVENNKSFNPEMTPLERIRDCKIIIYNEFIQHNIDANAILFEYLRENPDARDVIKDVESGKPVQDMYQKKYSWEIVLECLTLNQLSPEQIVKITLEASVVGLTKEVLSVKTGLDEKVLDEVLRENKNLIENGNKYQLKRNARISKSFGVNTIETKMDKTQKAFTLIYDGTKWTTKESMKLAKIGVKGGFSGAAAESISALLNNLLSDKDFVGLLKPGNEYSWSVSDLGHPALEGLMSWSVFEMKMKFMPITHGVIVIESMKNLSKVSEAEVGSATAREVTHLAAFMGVSSGVTYSLLKYNPFFRGWISHQIPLFMAVFGSSQITPIVEKHVLSGMKETLDNSEWMKGLASSMRFLDAVLPHNWMVDNMLPVTIAQVGDKKLTSKDLEKINPKNEAEYIVNWVMAEEFKASKYAKTTGLFAVKQGVLSIGQADILSIKGYEEGLLSNIYGKLGTEYIRVYNNRFNNMTGRVMKVPKNVNELIKMIEELDAAKDLSKEAKKKLAEQIYVLFDYNTLSDSKTREVNMELLFVEDQVKNKDKYSFTKEERKLYRTRMVNKQKELQKEQSVLAQKYKSSKDSERMKIATEIIRKQGLIDYYTAYTKEENDDGIILGMMQWDAFIKSKSEYYLSPSILEQVKSMGVNLLGGYMDGMALKYSIKLYKGMKRLKAVETALNHMHKILFGVDKALKAGEVLSEAEEILKDAKKCKVLLKYLKLKNEVSTFAKIKRFGYKAKNMKEVEAALIKGLNGKNLEKALAEGASVVKKALSMTQRARETAEILSKSKSKTAQTIAKGFKYGLRYMDKFKTLVQVSPKAMSAIKCINVYGSKIIPKASTLLKWAKPLVVLDQVSSIGSKYHENWDDLVSSDHKKRNAAQFKIAVTSAGGFLVEGVFDIIGLGDAYDYSLNFYSKSGVFQWTFDQLNKPAESISNAFEYFSTMPTPDSTASTNFDTSEYGV